MTFKPKTPIELDGGFDAELPYTFFKDRELVHGLPGPLIKMLRETPRGAICANCGRSLRAHNINQCPNS